MKKILSTAWLCALALCAQAQTASKPVIHKANYTDYSIVWNVSDNGKWAVLMGATGEQQQNGRAKLASVSDLNTPIYLQTTADENRNGKCTVADVTDDGNIVVGSYAGVPAYWTKSTGTWTKLTLPSDYTGGGEVSSVTPDGKYAVGTVYQGSYGVKGLMWNLATNDTVKLTNLPGVTLDAGETSQSSFTGISADGRYVLIVNSVSYSPATYIYDTQNNTYVRPGYTKNDDGTFTPVDANLLMVESPIISSNGKHFAAWARVASGELDEYITTMTYNVETGETTLFTASDEHDIVPAAIDNAGNVYGASPSQSSPVREWSVRVGQFWYPFSQITSQVYGMNFYTTTNYDNTGTPFSISDDSKVLSSMIDSNGGGTYVVEMPDDFASVCQTIDLLGNYSVTPASGVKLTNLSSIDVLFDRDIKALGKTSAAVLKDASGATKATSVGFAVSNSNSKMLHVTFRPSRTAMDAGQTYTLEIPAGSVALATDNSKLNKAINLTYTGRGSQAVSVKNIYPADHSQIAKIDNNSNPVYLTFDAQVQVTDTASAQLVRKADNTLIANLTVVAQDTMVALYPSASQSLYDGQEYTVTLAKGSVSDLSGNGGNEALTINYHGTYVRELNTSNDSVFFDNFGSTSTSLATWMLYEGDHLTPTTAMTGLAFDADNQPWNFTVRESSTSNDNCAASHSMYTPAGRSDDWMVIPQIYVADEGYKLSFDAQSYRKAKSDTLKVLVWACNENFNEMTAATIARIKAEGDVVINERLTPGLTEEDLEGDWQNYSYDLSAYKGKNIYIAFWNNNEDQSMIFVDNVLVKNNIRYSIALSNAEAVVAQESIEIRGRLTVRSESETYSSVELTLRNAAGEAVSTFSQTGTELKKGSEVSFAFANPLPLTLGEVNDFSIDVKLDNTSDKKTGSVKCLAFQPVRRVVLEEFTGTTCGNCPLGILAIDRMKEMYKGQFVPVSIHTYNGDPYASGMGGYSSFLNLTAAPSGIVDRSGYISSPMWQSPYTADYEFNNGVSLWGDLVASELDTPADMELNLGDAAIDDAASTFTLPISIRAAVNLKNQSINVFVAVLEDSIVSSQTNYLYNVTDANLGDWGKGGRYGNAENYNIIHNDVARAAYGTSFNGTAGFFPQTLTAGETYAIDGGLTLNLPDNLAEQKNAKAVVMLIDGNSDKVINAAVTYFDADRQAAGIASVAKAEANGAATYYDLQGRRVEQPAKGLYIVRKGGVAKTVYMK